LPTSCRASPRSVEQDIGSSPWLYVDISCPYTAAVHRPSLQITSVLLLVVSICPSSWSHSLFLRFCRSMQFVWFLTAGLLCHFLSCSSYALSTRTALPHKFPFDPLEGAAQQLLYRLLHMSTQFMYLMRIQQILNIGMECDPNHLVPSPH
jgi:hypothetical protein